MSSGTYEFETTQPSESRYGSHKRNDQEETYATSPVEAPRNTQSTRRTDCPQDIELRQRQQTPQGRAQLRERVAVEHTLAHVGQWQGRQARYRGIRKNLFDLRRCAVVHNLHVLARSQQSSAELQKAA